MSKIIIYFVRFIFLGLIFFEGANLFKILHFTLDFSWLGLVLTAIAVWFILEFVKYISQKKYHYNFPVFIFIIPTINILFDAFGDIFHLYSRINGYDKIMHFFGGAAACSLAFFILKGIFLRRDLFLSNKFIGFFSFLIANFLGILYELEEFFESLFLHNNRLGDRFDTPGDLFFNMMGALVGVLIVLIIQRARDLGKNKK